MYTEDTMIDEIAKYERAIVGVRNSYDFARNPDKLNATELPAVIHYSPVFRRTPRGHFNLWEDVVQIRSVLFVIARDTTGGKLRYIENEAVPFGKKWRDKFSDGDVVRAILSATGAVSFRLTDGRYGAGGELLDYSGTTYTGWILDFEFKNA